ncbi:MAG: methyltransferase domain-containing protein [Kiloniellales bacterium]|nr:methyltransferase domain-containing protein [Kiloniellales bacterium]
MPKAPRGKLADVSGKDVSIDPAEHYDAWADSYDRDLLQEYGYRAHRIAAKALSDLLPDGAARIIDVGCGTGLVGLELAKLGYGRLEGVDISEGMLAEAAKTGVYQELIRQDAEKAPAPEQGVYDAVISVGSFGLGHLGPEAFPNLVSLARPGAPVVIFMNAEPYVDQDYARHVADLERDGVWVVTRIEDHNYMDALERPGKLILARRPES